LRQRGLMGIGARREKHRKRRERSALPRMMLFQDGSRHAWLADGPPLDLIATMDDATGTLTLLYMVEEVTASSFRGLSETIARHGLFSPLYTDLGSHYFVTSKAGERVDKDRETQVGRA
jgi:hypothetical protein